MAEELGADRLLREREAMEFLGKSPTWLWRARKEGQIDYIRLGGEIRYRLSALEKFIERNTHKAVSGD